MPAPITVEQWEAIWRSINLDFKPFRVSDDDLALQGAEWYRSIRRYSNAAIEDAWAQYRTRFDTRPRLSHIMAGAREYTARVHDALMTSAKLRDQDNPNRCPCGCGGKRWARILTDDSGDPRAIGDQYVTRDELECLRLSVSLTHGTKYGTDRRDVPMMLPDTHKGE